MTTDPTLAQRLLPFVAPVDAPGRAMLYAMRRMAAGGLDDARAVMMLLGMFGRNYRRPLVLLRAFMAELSRVALRRISVAPCCCLRMTRDEATILRAIETALEQPHAAHQGLCGVTDRGHCLAALTSAQAVAAAFADLGRPLRPQPAAPLSSSAA